MFNRLCLLLGCGLALPVLAQVGYLETPVQPASGQSALNFANGEDALRDGRTTVYGSGELEHALGDGSTINSDGDMALSVGDTTLYSNGETAEHSGNITVYDDGTLCQRVGERMVCD